MLYTVVSLDDIFYGGASACNSTARSTNPYDYIRKGWFLDNNVVYRGVSNVNLKFNYPVNTSGDIRNSAD